MEAQIENIIGLVMLIIFTVGVFLLFRHILKFTERPLDAERTAPTRIVDTCLGRFAVEGDTARSVTDGQTVYRLPRRDMETYEIVKYIQEIKELKKTHGKN